MATPDLQLRELRIWRLDHGGAVLRVTRAPESIANVAVLVTVGLMVLGVGAFGLVDVGFGEAGEVMAVNERRFVLAVLALMVGVGILIGWAAWRMHERGRHHAILVDAERVHVRHDRRREDTIPSASVERVEVVGRRLASSSQSRASEARVDVMLAPGPGPEPYVLAMWSLAPDSEQNRATLEREARALAGQIAIYLGDKPVQWRGFV